MPSGNATLFSASNANLPPLSSRLLKALKDKDYIDLSSLLPHMLYDINSGPSYSLQLQPGYVRDGSVSLTQTPRTSQTEADPGQKLTRAQGSSVYEGCDTGRGCITIQ